MRQTGWVNGYKETLAWTVEWEHHKPLNRIKCLIEILRMLPTNMDTYRRSESTREEMLEL